MESDLIPERLTTRLVDSNKFEGTVRSTEFEIRENRQVSHKCDFPIIKGTMEVQGKITTITLSFDKSKSSKIMDEIILFAVFLLALIPGWISKDILFTMTFLCIDIFMGLFMLTRYMYYCRRAYKKLCKIWDIPYSKH
jgi:hypothetical protein